MGDDRQGSSGQVGGVLAARLAVVTGAAGGLGRDNARCFAGNAGDVVLADVRGTSRAAQDAAANG